MQISFVFLSLELFAVKALTSLLLDEDENQETSSKKTRKHWIRPWLENRQLFGCYYSLFQELKRYMKAFKEFIRMEESQFEFLMETLVVFKIKVCFSSSSFFSSAMLFLKSCLCAFLKSNILLKSNASNMLSDWLIKVMFHENDSLSDSTVQHLKIFVSCKKYSFYLFLCCMQHFSNRFCCIALKKTHGFTVKFSRRIQCSNVAPRLYSVCKKT